MGAVASAVSDVVGGAVEAVGDAVEDVGQAVVEDVIEPIAKTVEATVEKAMDDPIGTAIQVAAVVSGQWWALPLATASLTVAHGGSLEDGLKAGAIAYVGGEIAQGVSAGFAPEFTAEFGAQAGKSMANVAGNVASTVVRGGDPLQALISGGIGAGTAALTSDIPGFADMSKYQQQAVNSAISKTLQGRDPSQGLLNEAIASGIGAAQSYSAVPSDELMEQPTSQPAPVYDYAEPEPSPAPSSELVDQTITQQPDAVIAEAPVYEDFDYAPQPTVPDGVAPSTDLMSSLQPTNTETPDLAAIEANDQYYDNSGVGPLTSNYFDALGNEFTSNGTPIYDTVGTGSLTTNYFDELGNEFSPDGTPIYDNDPRSSSSKKDTDFAAMARKLLAAGPSASSIGALGAGAALGASLFGGESEDGLVYTREPNQNQRVSYNPQAGSVRNGVAYGLDQLGATYTTEAAQGGIMSLARGGQIPSLGGYAAGGNPRLLRGPGDGMSDNIPATIAGKQPARLADGEFVVPADVVSHLGNGSTEAGASVLYQMMERVRKARTGNSKQGKQINPQKFVPRKGK
jgi:hypothetical protein